MEYVWVVLLGALQGVTEFLPVSSSGHLAIMQEMAGLEGPRLLMNVALHAGTLLSILVVFRTDLVEILRGSAGAILPCRWGRDLDRAVSEGDRSGLRTCIAIVETTIVTAPLALFLEPRLEHLNHDLAAIGGLLAITGILLAGTRYLAPGTREVGHVAALVVGLAQGMAVLPGISRSGATIVTALLLGVSRDRAVRFSFLAALPALAGALLLEGGLELEDLISAWPMYLTGAAVAFCTGWASLRILICMTRRRRLHLFAFYLVPVGLALLVWGG